MAQRFHDLETVEQWLESILTDVHPDEAFVQDVHAQLSQSRPLEIEAPAVSIPLWWKPAFLLGVALGVLVVFIGLVRRARRAPASP